ncbi:EpsG family protein [Sphingobacterium mizutaii]|uniref:EpsG family protein n=1 Tax=Sphingobacterium mizutaii TaxID=1010 RepID=UPI0028A05CCC|nr:EpsG family protein [Sphingobacterium mizutaii]
MKLTIKKNRFESLLLLILIPILSIPSIILQIIRKDKWGGYSLGIIVGLIGFLYVPSLPNDKARYYERYEIYDSLSFDGFVDFIIQLKKPDFIFDFGIYLFSRFNIPFEFFFFFLSCICIILPLKIINELIQIGKVKMNYSYLSIVSILVISFSLPGLYSGARFTLGLTVFVYGLIKFLIFQKRKSGLLIILLSTQIHFSLLFLCPSLLLFNNKILEKLPFRALFIISFIFFLIPSSVITQLFGFLSFSESLSNKTTLYTEGTDFVSQNFDSNEGSYAMFIIRGLWYYFMIITLLIFGKKLIFNDVSAVFVKLLYFLIFLSNLTYGFPTIFTRYILVVKLVLTIFLIYLYVYQKSSLVKTIFYLTFILFLCSFFIDIYVLRYNFLVSLFSDVKLSIINILSTRIHSNDFIK